MGEKAMTEAITVGAGLLFAAIICIGTYLSGCMAPPDELDALPPLDGDPLDEGWGRLR